MNMAIHMHIAMQTSKQVVCMQSPIVADDMQSLNNEYTHITCQMRDCRAGKGFNALEKSSI